MSSLIKTFYNNYLYHSSFENKVNFNPSEVRFTKVLTKYSTEYNNSVFLQQLSFKLQIDKPCLKMYFDFLRNKISSMRSSYNHKCSMVQPATIYASFYSKLIVPRNFGQCSRAVKGGRLKISCVMLRGFESHHCHKPPGGACGSVPRDTVFVF